jgi:fibronectin-binding autotransporter adhesin
MGISLSLAVLLTKGTNMKEKQRLHLSKSCFGVTVVAMCLFSVANLQAATYIWDPGATGGGGGGGAGTWDVSTAKWYDSTIPGDVTWTAGGDAEFDNTGGLITITTDGTTGVSAQNMTFNVDAYRITAEKITLAGTPTITTAAGQAEIDSVVADAAQGFTKTGTGTLYLYPSNPNLTGKITVNQGTLKYRLVDSLGANPGAFVANQITLAAGTTLEAVNGTAPGGNAGITTTGTGFVTIKNDSSGSHLRTAAITGTTGIKIVCLGNKGFAPGAGSNYNGDTEIVQGSIQPAANNCLPYGAGKGNLILDAGTSIYWNNTSQNINGLYGAAGTSIDKGGSGTRAFTFGNGDANGDFSGTLKNTGTATMPLTKVGTGTQIFRAGQSTNPGTLTISAGTVKFVDGATLASNLWDVQSGSTLDITDAGYTFLSGKTLEGKGTVLGNVTMQGTLSPGESAGQLTVDGNVSLSGDFKEEITGNVAGTSYDQLLVTGANHTVSLGGTLTITAPYIAGATDMFWVVNDSDPSTTLSGAFTNYPTSGTAITGLPGLTGFGVYYNADFATGSLSGGNDVVIAYVPEPATVSMLLAAIVMLGGVLAHKRRCK